MNFAEFISPVTVVTGVTGGITIVIELLIKALLYSNPLIQYTRKYVYISVTNVTSVTLRLSQYKVMKNQDAKSKQILMS